MLKKHCKDNQKNDFAQSQGIFFTKQAQSQGNFS